MIDRGVAEGFWFKERALSLQFLGNSALASCAQALDVLLAFGNPFYEKKDSMLVGLHGKLVMRTSNSS